jgi:prepilin-type N-terminal cleavage/methylation domain-containing protein
MATQPKHNGAKAFTLLELILVMIILCTVLAMAAPTLRGFFSSHQLNDVAEQILVMTRYAKIQSVFEGRFYRVNIDENEYRCWVTVLGEKGYEPLYQGFGNDFLIPPDIKLDFDEVEERAGIYYFDFNPQGYSKPGRVRLADDQGNVLDVVCYSPSEYFEIFEVIDGRDQYEPQYK